ncbi:efflux RND transporter periplasmic adaptor subunit [Actinoplanes sp. NPDC051851]|uniref:efflux RND transporter periplasmic adaptor subunit n=1 Tax=Actinoplanes sp. NPDC051851 TaxID=3154753 RepID=UPI00344500F1
MRRGWRVATGSVTGVALVAGVLVTGYTLTATPATPASASEVPTSTAEVVKGTVSERFRLAGTYGFGGSYAVYHQGRGGILTGAAAAGTTVNRGGVLYRVDGEAVHLLLGVVPAHQDLEIGARGEDVRQLERNLRALGMDPDHEMTVDTRYTAATAAAVRRLQKKWGLAYSDRTGTLVLGSVVFLKGPIRISTVEGTVGTSVHQDQGVLTGTGTGRVITSELTADKQGQVEVGDKVSVTLPGSKPLEGKVLRVGKVATSETDQEGNSEPATVELIIGVTVPKGTADLDQASAQLTLASEVHENVLTVPVSALLASPDGGYRVRLADGTYARVEPGIFDDATGTVEISGDVAAGDRVEVPQE